MAPSFSGESAREEEGVIRACPDDGEPSPLDSAQLAEDLDDAIFIAASWPGGLRRCLMDRGLVGHVRSNGACVLARYFEAITKADCLVGSTTVFATRGQQLAEVRLPTRFALFVEAFDRGEFPELIDAAPDPGGIDGG
jgi:hypothetical protein